MVVVVVVVMVVVVVNDFLKQGETKYHLPPLRPPCERTKAILSSMDPSLAAAGVGDGVDRPQEVKSSPWGYMAFPTYGGPSSKRNEAKFNAYAQVCVRALKGSEKNETRDVAAAALCSTKINTRGSFSLFLSRMRFTPSCLGRRCGPRRPARNFQLLRRKRASAPRSSSGVSPFLTCPIPRRSPRVGETAHTEKIH